MHFVHAFTFPLHHLLIPPHPTPTPLWRPFMLLQSCGTINTVTILTDKFGNPKAYAYIEFLEVDAVNNAVLLDNTELKGRPLKVCACIRTRVV